MQLELTDLKTKKKNLIAILSIIMVLLGIGSWRLLDFGVRSVTLYQSPYIVQLQPGPGSQPLAQRLILVIVDGFESESFENMLAVRDMAGRGVAVSFQGNQGLSLVPASTVLMTGALPEVSGVVTNWHNTDVMIDSLWSSASRADLSTIIIGDAKWKPLFGDIVTQGIYHEIDDNRPNSDINDSILKDALKEIKQGKSELILVSFLPEGPGTNTLAEMRTKSTAREQAAASIDTRLSRLMESVDLSSNAVFVTLGHSLLTQGTLADYGKKTLDIRLVAAGAGIVTPDSPPETIHWISRRLVDVAPTCACLLGISMPTHSQGEAIFDALDAPSHTLSEMAIRQTAARARFAPEYLKSLGRQADNDWSCFSIFLPHNDGNYEEAYEAALDLDEEISLTLSKARSAVVASSRLVSIPILIAIAALLVCILARLLENNVKDSLIAGVAIFVYFTVYYGLFLLRGIPLSSSAISYPLELARFYHGRILDSVVSLVLMAIIVGWLVYRREKNGEAGQGLVAGLVSPCFTIAALAVQIGMFIVTEGVTYALYLPDMQKGFRCSMYLIQLMVVGILSPIAACLSKGVFLLASQVELSRSGKHEPPDE